MARSKKSSSRDKVYGTMGSVGHDSSAPSPPVRDHNGHFLPGHKGVGPAKPKQMGNRALVDAWFRECGKDNVPRARRVLEEIFARAMGDPEAGEKGDNRLLVWLGDRVVAPLRPREVEEDEEPAGAMVLVRDRQTGNFRVQGPAIEAVVGEPPWRTAGTAGKEARNSEGNSEDVE